MLRRLFSSRSWRFVERRVGREFLSAAVLVFLVLVACAILYWLFEQGKNEDVTSFWSGFEWVTRTLLEQASPWAIVTPVGKFLNYVVLVAGVGLVAIATGAIASKLFTFIMRKDLGMGEAKFTRHIVICGWSTKGAEILRELHAEEVEDKTPIALLAPLETSPTRDPLVTFVRGNTSNSEDLSRAGIERADTAIILADTTNPANDADDIDAKTLLTTLAVESLNPNCYTCVEVIKSENRQHFQRTKADELVVSAELTGALLASSAVTHGLSHVISDLLTHPQGNEFYQVDAPQEIIGKSFFEAMQHLKESYDCIPMAIRNGGAGWQINPGRDFEVVAGAQFLVIAGSEITASIGSDLAGSRVRPHA
ncbi:MAG: NAD-binding protein [Actinomycetota bacterium]|nr:NAD-binding protein [Actinomycetota bacterium]